MTDDHFSNLPPKDRLGNQPVDPNLRESLNEIAKVLDFVFNGKAKGAERKVGFLLMAFGMNDREGRCNYISNGVQRADVIRLMEEQINRFRTDRDDDTLMVDTMADAIQGLCNVPDRALALAAASVCLTIYRKGPERFHFKRSET